MLNIVLFGPPGSGKGTQSEFIIEKFSLIHLSTGDILRNEICNKTELGLKAKAIMDQGGLVSDEIVIDMIGNEIEANRSSKGFIFDGFPRTVSQAEALDKLLMNYKEEVNLMIALEVEDDELVARLLKRGKDCGRADDNLETIRKRIEVYNMQTTPVIEYYKSKGKFQSLNGAGSLSEISSRIVHTIDGL